MNGSHEHLVFPLFNGSLLFVGYWVLTDHLSTQNRVAIGGLCESSTALSLYHVGPAIDFQAKTEVNLDRGLRLESLAVSRPALEIPEIP